MNWVAIPYVALGLLAFPLGVIGITASASGMLMVRRISKDEEQPTDWVAIIEGAFRHRRRDPDEPDPQGRPPS